MSIKLCPSELRIVERPSASLQSRAFAGNLAVVSPCCIGSYVKIYLDMDSDVETIP